MIRNYHREIVALAFVFVCSVAGSANLCTVAGVSGDSCPDLRFDESTGIMTFNADGTAINSLLITGPDPGVNGLLDPDGNWPVAADFVGNAWTVTNLPRVLTGTYSYFNGKYQNIMFTDSANRGWDTTTDLAIVQYPAGTRLTDFGQVELLTWDANGTPPPSSQILLTNVVAIPEPTGWLLTGVVLAGFGLIHAFLAARAWWYGRARAVGIQDAIAGNARLIRSCRVRSKQADQAHSSHVRQMQSEWAGAGTR